MSLLAPSLQAVLFDLDGTLVDSAPDLAAAVDALLAELALPLAGQARVTGWVGNGARRLVQRALAWAEHGGDESAVSDARLDDALQRFMIHYEGNLSRASCLYPGVAETLDKLRLCGFRLAVVTNKPMRFVPPLLASLGIGRHFGLVLGGDSLPVRKPAPEPLLHCAAHWRLAPTECLMVGDSLNDLIAAERAGMPAVAVSYGYHQGADLRSTGALAVIDALPELLG